jgi:hypothetical protein
MNPTAARSVASIFWEGNWFAPYYADVGGGDSKLTWQAMAGVGYAYKWGDVVLAYRYLSYEQGGNKLLEDVNLGGFALGVNFRFQGGTVSAIVLALVVLACVLGAAALGFLLNAALPGHHLNTESKDSLKTALKCGNGVRNL